eukprot:TRINITY_DN1170_c0_g1_i1.p1 TRINITY_DN1170_c0_g1~~TRINITY_DN1170_c0_g1_i1.p1  ORF type:complete len:915 (-),score=219.15 TRINITY_DN1170_c0_g1_i1:232-2913(-)
MTSRDKQAPLLDRHVDGHEEPRPNLIGARQKFGRMNRLVKWFCPMAFAMFGFYCQSVGLHYATYTYVKRHYELKDSMSQETWAKEESLFEVLSDPLEHWLSADQKNIKLAWLDTVAALFPMFFCFLAFIDFVRPAQDSHALQCWTKTMTCAGFLFMIKGSLGAMTSVPDSSGWEVCSARLKEEGIAWMRQEHTFWDMLSVDFEWYFLWYHHPLRYCSDMMYSGHTFVVTLFALGCYEIVRIVVEGEMPPKKDKHFQCLGRFFKLSTDKKDQEVCADKVVAIVLCLLSFVAIGEQCLEIYCVMVSRFHYSMDVFMAIIITFLFYSNGAISVFAKQWEQRGLYFFVSWIPPLLNNPPSLSWMVFRGEESTADHWREHEVWNTRGDVFIPVCCVPFCMFSGRQHVYSDKGMKDILIAADVYKQNRKWLDNELKLDEGISLKDVKDILSEGLTRAPTTREMEFKTPDNTPKFKSERDGLPRARRSRVHTSVDKAFSKWLMPMLFMMLGFYLQSVGLHYATYSYVHGMLAKMDAVSHAEWRNNSKKLYERLYDPVEEASGSELAIHIGALDMIAAAIPAIFMALCAFDYLRHRKGQGKCIVLQIFTKVATCAGFLFIIKGCLGAMTTVPDSDGWDVCTARLGAEGIDWMKEDHSLLSMFALDFQWNVLWYHHPLRYCSDMMYSGHTFVVTLFALGCYEVTRVVLEKTERSKWFLLLKIVVLSGVALVAICEQAVEIYCVMRSRFHYSMDMFLAVIITFLFYTNGAIAVFSKLWEEQGFHIIYSFKDYLMKLLKKHEDMREIPLEDQASVKEWVTQEAWVTRGDIFLPPCCIPCCCLAGRQHVYSDESLTDAIEASGLLKSPITGKMDQTKLKVLQDELNMHEGISFDDLLRIKQSFMA